MKSIPYGKQHITEQDIAEVVLALKADFLTQGPRIAEFEINFANYIGAKYAVAVSNGTAALHLCNMALNVKKGDKVITTPITFAASANSVLYCNGEVDFVDINSETYTIDLDKLEEKLRNVPRGTYKGVIPVDFAGYPVDTERLRKIADEYKLWIIEDACHAPGGYFMNSKNIAQKCGNGQYSDLSIFSFHPVKHIASGEGGMITTNDNVLYKKLLMLRTHGITKENLKYDFPEPNKQGAWYYEMQDLGYNYRITDIQAALGNSQLKNADKGLLRRQEIANKYRKVFDKLSIKCQKYDGNHFNAHHLFVIEVENRKELYEFLRQNNIYAQVHYIPVHLLNYYKQFGWKEGDFPNAENYYKHCISLPMYPSLTDKEQDFVIKKVIEFIGKQFSK